MLLPDAWNNETVSIVIVGAGGTGSQMADQLASLQKTLMALNHPGFTVKLFDGDEVSHSNVGRQRFTHSDIGLNKAIILCHRINAFYSLDWQAVNRSATVTDLDQADLIITCVDKAIFRADVGKKKLKGDQVQIWLDMGNSESVGQSICGHRGEAPNGQLRVPNVFDLYPELANMKAEDKQTPSCSAEEAIQRQAWPINRIVAMAGADLLWTLFRKGRLNHHGAQISLDPMTVTPMPIDPAAWAFYGYSNPVELKKASKKSRAA